ncbi:DUF6285 domain-containing protein [Phenylobacterium montanum]|uniref:Protein kinase n=1 Tax=Phenylobacterium montanum TaxID=2823693 RepID=A0A975FYL9_9CAUL|nr:DUF6285 domain-containing protein [Caulobacter sp. S6]QUD87576.1 protein kinase [Caulobacter sp. S6]
MQDQPHPSEVIGAVAEFLRNTVIPKADPLTAFQTRVAVNALEMMRRQLDLAPAAEAAELERLKVILGHDGTLAELNAELSSKIAEGALDLTAPGLRDHLWTTTLDKLAVDQPTYAAYRAALQEHEQKS